MNKEENFYRFEAIGKRLDEAETTGITFNNAVKDILDKVALQHYPVFKEYADERTKYLKPFVQKYSREVFECFNHAHFGNANQTSTEKVTTNTYHDIYKKEYALRKELKVILVKFYEEDLLNFDGSYLKMLDNGLLTSTIWFFDDIASLFSRRSGALYHLISKEDAH